VEANCAVVYVKGGAGAKEGTQGKQRVFRSVYKVEPDLFGKMPLLELSPLSPNTPGKILRNFPLGATVTKVFLHQLFDSHTADLAEVCPQLAGSFICPICLLIFERGAIADELVDDGHVWPKHFRKGRPKAAAMHVLLCKSCNGKAGTQGDNQIQLYENIRHGNETGDLYGTRRVQLFPEGDEKPIDQWVKVKLDKDGSLTISGRVDKTKKWRDGSPKDQARFEELFSKQRRAKIIIHDLPALRPQTVAPGLITSAYLYAFWALGYRYILHKILDPVREHITTSFTKKDMMDWALPVEDNFQAGEFGSARYETPHLYFALPAVAGQYLYSQIRFLRYQVRLPFHCNELMLGSLAARARAEHRVELEQLQARSEAFYLRIPCTKTQVHDCWWDYFMGKPLLRATSQT